MVGDDRYPVDRILLMISVTLSDMDPSYDKTDIPPDEISIDGHVWTREEFDADSFQWTRKLDDEEYDWDPDEDDIVLVGTDDPIRTVILEYWDGEWDISGSETAGPDYHRPGYTEVISSEYSASKEEFDEAVNVVEEYIRQLS
jgi:hypothetical protein